MADKITPFEHDPDAQAEALANQATISGMGPGSEGGWVLSLGVPPEITAVFLEWARAVIRDAPNY